jgi:hypothetical protein
MQSFLESLLPTQGLYCTARSTKEVNGEIVPIPYFLHRWFDTVEQAEAHVEAMDRQGHTMYMAQSAFYAEKVRAAEQFNASLPKGHDRKLRHKLRAQVNVSSVRSFWFDIDCGEEKFATSPNKCYRSQKEASEALKLFVNESGLPFPSVVSSGNGLYAHWLLDTDIPASTWEGLAQILKKISHAYGFKTDDARTSDSASVLRPPGTHNRKNGAEKPVSLVRGSEPLSFSNWVYLLNAAAKAREVDTSALKPPKDRPDLNSAFLRGIDSGPPSSAHVVADKCAQMRRIRDTKGNVEEPLWYAAIGILKATVEGREIIHEWSCGHPDYTPEETDQKIDQHNFPPTTCEHFGGIDASACIGCSYKGKAKSPIVLGFPKSALLPTTPDDPAPECPAGYSRRVDGIYFEDDPAIRIYDYDFFPVRLAADEWMGQETITYRHKTPHNGWKEFTIRTSLCHDPKAFMMALTDNHVHVVGGRERKLFVSFADDYTKKLREKTRLSQLHPQMGWRESDKGMCFVLGETVVHQDGTEEKTGFSKNVPEAVRAFKSQGDTSRWVAATEYLNRQGYEGHAFALLAGAFGAPLMRFTGYSGAMISMVGPTGVGKSMMGKWVLSAYGDHSRLMMLRDDTYNALISRLAIYGTLPLCLDEITNVDGMNLSDLVYRVTQGRDKSRLQKNSVEKNNPNQWNTLALVSSNSSLVDKLGGVKADASAEISRVLEYAVPLNCFKGESEICTEIHRAFEENHGGVGIEYIRYLSANYDKHRTNLDRIRVDLDQRTHASTEERFWSAVLAVSIYGGLIAQKLGLIRFDVERVRDWGVELVQSMRVNKGDNVMSNQALLGMVLNRHAGNCLGVTDSNNRIGCAVIREPRGAIYYRFEMDTKKLFIDRAWLNRQLREEFASLTDLKIDLKSTKPRPALVNENARKSLGAGTHFSTVATPVWEIDLAVPELGHLGLQLVKTVTTDHLSLALAAAREDGQ